MRMRWAMRFLLIATCGLALSGIRAAASPVDGTWRVENLVLDLHDCDNSVCGRIVWINDPARRPAQCGQTIVWGLTLTGPSEWSEGHIRDPDDGNVYRLSATLEPDGVLNARIYKGLKLFGTTKQLKRVDLHALTGQC
jgi:uncharacterized protein (DUF2147 family)